MDAVANSKDALVSNFETTKPAQRTSLGESQDRFLKLLVSQLKNQDPLHPLDNAQVTTQMAQISTVSGIERLNDTLATLLGQVTASQSLQAAGLVGRGVLAPGPKLVLDSGNALFGVELPKPADRAVVTIRDALGNTMHSMNLGPQPAGIVALNWDGKTDSGLVAANGAYTFEIVAEQAGKRFDTGPLSFGRVDAVSQGKTGATLHLSGGRQIDFSEVKQIL
jgi:flagellar basal-body rod modification protein FlgD